MRSKSKKRIDILKWRKEVEFVDQWPKQSKPLEYDGLVDKHNLYYFQLPSVQKHLKKLKRKAKKQHTSTQKEALLIGLQRNSIIFGSNLKRRSLSSKKIKQNDISSMKNRRNAQSSHSLSSKKLYSITEQLPRLRMTKKLPSIASSHRVLPARVKTQRESSIEKYNVIQQIIKRRLGTDFQ